jgi:soluble lytic murein transglycosylase-like protein
LAALRILAVAVVLAWAVPAAADPVDRWAGHIAEASYRFGVPADWIRRVMRAESGGRTLLDARPIVSRAGAMGLMQLMPGTWRDMQALLGLGPNPHDPRDNILAGAAYLRLMYDRFGYPGLFAAYNAGPARYAASLSGRRTLPAETRFYVAGVARADMAPPLTRARQPQTLFVLPSREARPSRDPGSALLQDGTLFVQLSNRVEPHPAEERRR